ncbi:4-hydroxy-tetrahydrodipicolinate synthase [Sedimentibacter sp. zth1]|uniref:4-hydroxy-tetrahydrodipicolinate synthase n=1 Tax=Sedimentibacter sp. zth1 TaxID=2816908 RepID=UPI001A90E690|nr:4-hydroxy-tetrahydrodipicolinate synthase [Sedimentibacter sp. zth1]QSX05129.1 4-hydroxy-tetrahydrodipicolinate synthase [Sedimentibacter sp. zth1]
MSLFTGAATALVTPFKNGAINYDKLDGLIEWQIRKHIDALVIAGTTGEASTLSEEEHKDLIKHSVKRINNRIPVIVGTGSNNTNHCLKMSRYAEENNADALLIVTPYYNKTTQVGAVKHYTYIADRINIPIIIYNVPSRTGFHISAESVVELSHHKNIAGIKEASGNISYVADIASKVDDDFLIYSGNDDVIVPVLSLGGKGVISVVSNIFPFETHNIVKTYLEGNINESKRIQLELLNFINVLFVETNPIPVKTCLNLLGKDVGELRLPLCDMSIKNIEILKKEMKKIGLGYL